MSHQAVFPGQDCYEVHGRLALQKGPVWIEIYIDFDLCYDYCTKSIGFQKGEEVYHTGIIMPYYIKLVVQREDTFIDA